MSDQRDRLYDLLPVVHRQRDAELGWPLRALLRVIAEQVNVVEADIDQLYENWFIETCEEWVVPYIADLVGYRVVHEAGEPGDVTTAAAQQRNKILIPRREVADTLALRRRKGTLALLERLANQVAGWPARAVEFYRLLGWNQPLNHLYLARGRTTDVRDGAILDLLDGPFDTLAHTVDIRRPNSRYQFGLHNIPSVALFVWRLKSYPVTRSLAYCLEEIHARCYTFTSLGHDLPLYTRWTPEVEPTTIAGELNLPVPIRRRALEQRPPSPRTTPSQANPDYYGEGRSLVIWIPGWAGLGEEPLPAERVIPADLTDWRYIPPRDYVAVDPVLGRLAFHPRQLPRGDVWVSYQYGFSADMGGGEYHRELSQPAQATLYRVGRGEQWPFGSVQEALTAWEHADPPPQHAVIEIQDNNSYVEQLRVRFQAEKQTLQIRAANETRPVLRMLDRQTSRSDAVYVEGKPGGRFTLDGVLLAGRGLQIEGPLDTLVIRHSTLVPGWWLDPNCDPRRPNEPSLELINTAVCVRITHSIIGSIIVNLDEVTADPLSICLQDSILDATADGREAISAPGCQLAHAALTIQDSTIIGETLVHLIELAENSIFTGVIQVGRRQRGCIRFSYVPPGSRTPRRYRCQPDLVDPDGTNNAERARVRPQFNSTRYGTPTYGQLALTCATEITRGADDESEMGAFHDLYQPQRAANLHARLEEYSPSGMDAGIIFAS